LTNFHVPKAQRLCQIHVRITYVTIQRKCRYLKEPEKNLLIAILQDAIHDYRKYYRARDREGKGHFREAQKWIMAGGDNWIFSFDSICELLGLDPDYIRLAFTSQIRIERSSGKIIKAENCINRCCSLRLTKISLRTTASTAHQTIALRPIEQQRHPCVPQARCGGATQYDSIHRGMGMSRHCQQRIGRVF